MIPLPLCACVGEGRRRLNSGRNEGSGSKENMSDGDTHTHKVTVTQRIICMLYSKCPSGCSCACVYIQGFVLFFLQKLVIRVISTAEKKVK